MTTNATERIHFLATGFTYLPADGSLTGPGAVSRRGDELVVTEELRSRNTDRNGRCWLDLADDDMAQDDRYGRVIFRPGPFPPGELLTEPGMPEHADAAWEAREAAMRLSGSERTEALKRVDQQYGSDSTVTSRTISQRPV